MARRDILASEKRVFTQQETGVRAVQLTAVCTRAFLPPRERTRETGHALLYQDGKLLPTRPVK